jgi:hypothetical protein
MRAALALALWEVRASGISAVAYPHLPHSLLAQWHKDRNRSAEAAAYRLDLGAGCALQIGKRGEAETQWGRVDDIRYKDANWLKSQRHWPPRCLLPTTSAA